MERGGAGIEGAAVHPEISRDRCVACELYGDGHMAVGRTDITIVLPEKEGRSW